MTGDNPGGTPATLPDSIDPEHVNPGRELSGRTLHHYRVIEKLGQGGMGEVWVAEDLHLERRVALKLLPASDAVDSDRLLRFEQEAKAVAALDHPNIVTLHSIEEADSLRFLTMELVGGKRLDAVIPDGGMDLAEFLGYAIPIADAIAAAHAKGITHRDLKPANVVLTPDGRPKVLDFGLAKLRDPVQDADAEVGQSDPAGDRRTATPRSTTLARTASQVREVEGTVPYMSPEQLTGEPADLPTDVFSLGVVFYEMLTGSRPFVADHLVTLMASILRDPPPPLEQLRPDLPPQLAGLLRRCLEKRPEARFSDAGELRDALLAVRDEWLSGSQTALRAPRRARSTVMRRVAASAVLGGAAVVAVLLGWLPGGLDSSDPVGVTLPGGALVEPKRIAVVPFDNLGNEDDSYFAAGIAEEIRSRLAAVHGLGVISRSAVARYASEGRTRSEIAEALGVDYLLEGTVRWDRSREVDRVRVTPQLVRVADDTQVWSDTYDRQLEDIFSVQTEIAEEVIGNLDIALFPAERQAVGAARPTSSLPAYQAYLRARDRLSDSIYGRAGYEEAIRELETAVRLDPEFTLAHAEVAQGHSMMYHLGHDRTPERVARAQRSLDRATALAPEAAEVRLARGYHRYRIEQDYDGALADFRVVVDKLPSAADGLEAMAYVLRRQGLLPESAQYLERAISLSPGTGRLLIEVATTRLFLRQYNQAEKLYQQAILEAPNDPNVYRAMALTYWMSSGDLSRARQSLESLPPGNSEPVNLWYWFHQLLYEGDYQAALAAIDGAETDMVHWTFFAYPTDLFRGQVYDLLGRRQEADAAFAAAAVQLRDQIARSPTDSRLHSALGLALAGAGQSHEAIAAAKRGVELLPVELDAGTGPYRLLELTLTQTEVGDLEGALSTLQKLLAVPARVSKKLVEIDPRFAALVAHPGFADLVES